MIFSVIEIYFIQGGGGGGASGGVDFKSILFYVRQQSISENSFGPLAQAALCAPPKVAFAMCSWPLLLGKLSNLKSGKVWEISHRGGGGHRFKGKIPKLKVGNSVLVPT